jgi:hypothetical protein
MNNKILATMAILLFSFCTLAAEKKGVTINVGLSPAGSFQLKSSKVKGKMVKSADGSIRADKLKVSIKSLKSGIELRDEHMAKRLDSKVHKKIEIIKAIGKSGKGQGIIKIKGISKKFKFSYKEAGKFIKANFKLNLKSFKIEDLTYLGVGAKEVVTISATVPLKQ